MSVIIRFEPGALPFSWRCAIWPLIGQILVEKQYATTSQVLEARRNQLADAGKHLGEHLVALGYVTPSQIEEALRLQSRMRGGLAPEPKAEASASRARILVADDDPALRGLLANLLEMRGFSVTVTGDGEEALAAFQEGSYDCVITDWMMPRRDGLELARAVKTLNPLVQVIVCSGALDSATFEQHAKEGIIDGYLPKPFRTQAVYEVIQKALGYED
jgi:CheY-like chemotaxis protein